MKQALAQVKLTNAKGKLAGKYSGGMKRRLCVAIAMIGSPKSKRHYSYHIHTHAHTRTHIHTHMNTNARTHALNHLAHVHIHSQQALAARTVNGNDYLILVFEQNYHFTLDTFSWERHKRGLAAVPLLNIFYLFAVIFLDEPSTGLDPSSRYTLWSVITEVKKTCSMILTTHRYSCVYKHVKCVICV